MFRASSLPSVLFSTSIVRCLENFLFISESYRLRHGMPVHWATVESWLLPTGPFRVPAPLPYPPAQPKYPLLPRLASYDKPAPPEFWDFFPFRPLPVAPTTVVNVSRLEDLLEEHSSSATLSERLRGAAAVHELRHGADAHQAHRLPGAIIPNSGSVYQHGEQFSDSVCAMHNAGFLAGPFSEPPLPDFRSNSMIAAERKGKVRVIMNLSAPEGSSFNDAVDTAKLEKVRMATARDVGYLILACGAGARMWKFDYKDAYKLVPSKIRDLRLQGFFWVGGFFVETQEPFGAKQAVAAFDRLGATVMVLAIIISCIASTLVLRAVDDLTVVTPANSLAGPLFERAYRRLCSELNMPLAENCPNFDKAFSDSTVGTVLGVRFDTATLSWSLLPLKQNKLLLAVGEFLSGEPTRLRPVQEIMGALNDFGQMAPFLKCFRQPLYSFMASFQEDPSIEKCAPVQALADMRVWGEAIKVAHFSLPIPHRPLPPPLNAVYFTSDAAGASVELRRSKRVPVCPSRDRGVASISLTSAGAAWYCCRITWPDSFIRRARDEKGTFYGFKSATLEVIGLLLPFLTIPNQLRGRHVVLQVDNAAVVRGWLTKSVKNDNTAAAFIRALHIIAAFLSCTVHVVQLPRRSTASAELADRLSRRSTTRRAHRALIRHANQPAAPAALLSWLTHPYPDWQIWRPLLHVVRDALL